MCFCCCPCVPNYLSASYDSLYLFYSRRCTCLSLYPPNEKCHREKRAGQREVVEKMLFRTLREGKVGGVEVGGEDIKDYGAGRVVVVLVVVVD